MTDFETRSPLSHLVLRTGTATSDTGVSLTDRRGMAIAQVFAKKGKIDAIAKKLKISTKPGVATVQSFYTALPLSPGQWMLFASSGADGSFKRMLDKQIAKNGYVSEQSHSRVVVRISGTRAVDVLAKECRLDLHPSVARPGFCGQTIMAKMGVLLHKVDEGPTFDLAVFAGFADNFWHWIAEASAEFGVEVFREEPSH